MRKRLYIISGCNGAGKTTASVTLLPEVFRCSEYVNADDIARQISPQHPENVAIEAGRRMLQRIERLLDNNVTFSIETTLATRSYVNLVRKARNKGYSVILLFFWLNSPRLAMMRVAERVSKGGHGIPEPVISRRYLAGIKNLFKLFMSEVDYWDIYDNSVVPRRHVACGGCDFETKVFDNSLFNNIKQNVD